MAPHVREVCERYGVPYNAGPLPKQFGTVVRKIVKLALPPRARWRVTAHTETLGVKPSVNQRPADAVPRIVEHGEPVAVS